MTANSVPPKPVRADPETFPADKRGLFKGIRAALAAIPAYFEFAHPISGIDATDLNALTTLMGAAIEVQVVQALNGMRSVWDPDRRWLDYSFQRSSQAFPDVRLTRRTDAGHEVALGIELKGWFLLAKEGEPSPRYRVSPNACNPWDLICVIPWYLHDAVSGTPEITVPWVEQAKYTAQWRDYWWEFVRATKDPVDQRKIVAPLSAAPYPNKADLVSMVPKHDGGDNYGRLPRCKPLMDSFVEEALGHPILGIPARDWQLFLKVHAENAAPEVITRKILAMNGIPDEAIDAQTERVHAILKEIATLFHHDS